MNWKKISLGSISVLLAICCFSLVAQWVPVVRQKESFRRNFPAEAFQDRLQAAAPCWMEEQINRDFRSLKARKIDLAALEKTYRHICQKVSEKTPFYHYRILDNQLYKFIPKGAHFSQTDSRFEKAFKTLLVYAKVPDVDFILCPMDGIPEPYMPTHFFETEEVHDQAPILAQAKLREPLTNYIVLIPDQFSLHSEWGEQAREILELNQKIDWAQKKEVAIWRGGLTDIGVPNGQPCSHLYSSAPRFLLCKHSLSYPEWIDAGLSWVDPEALLAVEKEGVIKGGLSKEAHLLCKYLPVLDGHMCTYPGYQWRLLSNCVCLKQESDQIQWFYAALKPYIHYIPIQNNMEDLLDKIKWAQSHDSESREISERAQDFARQNLLLEDNYFYLYLVLSKLASCEAIDFVSLRKETKKDPQWKCIQFRKRLALKKSFDRFLSKWAG